MRRARMGAAVFKLVLLFSLVFSAESNHQSKRQLHQLRRTRGNRHNAATDFDPDSVDILDDSMLASKAKPGRRQSRMPRRNSQHMDESPPKQDHLLPEAGEGAVAATLHDRLDNAQHEQQTVIRASVRVRGGLQQRINSSPMLTKIANMGTRPQQGRQRKGKPIIDRKTGFYIDKTKPSLKQAVKRAQEISKKNVPLAVDWGDGIDPPHAPKDYVAAPEKMAAKRAKIIAERGGPNAPIPYPPPEPRPKKDKEKKN